MVTGNYVRESCRLHPLLRRRPGDDVPKNPPVAAGAVFCEGYEKGGSWGVTRLWRERCRARAILRKRRLLLLLFGDGDDGGRGGGGGGGDGDDVIVVSAVAVAVAVAVSQRVLGFGESGVVRALFLKTTAVVIVGGGGGGVNFVVLILVWLMFFLLPNLVVYFLLSRRGSAPMLQAITSGYFASCVPKLRHASR